MAFSNVCNTSSARLLDNDELQAWYGESDGGVSSGYDSGDVHDSDTEQHVRSVVMNNSQSLRSKMAPDVVQLFNNPLLFSDSDSDSDCLTDPEDSDSDDDSDSEFGDEDGDVMRFTSTENLCNSLQYILSMPELCDVTFHVGPQKTPIHGVKAILGTRSRVLYGMILRAEKELEQIQSDQYKKTKLTKQKGEKISTSTRLTIDVNTYEVDVFRRIIQFLHCGLVTVDSSSLIGLLCGSEEFGLKDLKIACWNFVDQCIKSGTELRHAMTSSNCVYNQKLVNSITQMIVARIDSQKSRASMMSSRRSISYTPRETIV